MSFVQQILEPLSVAASSAIKSVSTAADKIAETARSTSGQLYPPERGRPQSAENQTRLGGHQPRSSSLPARLADTAANTPGKSESSDNESDSDSEAQYDLKAKFPGIGLFGFGVWSTGVSTQHANASEEAEVLVPANAAEHHKEEGELPSKDIPTENTWSMPFNLNFVIPALPFLPGMSPAANTAPEGVPDASATSTAANAWTKAWASLSAGTMRETQPCGHHHPFHFMDGDVVVLGGMYGSFLSDAKTKRRAWVGMDAVLNWVSVDCALSLDDDDDRLVPSGLLDRLGPVNVCADLVQALTDWEACSKGAFRYHPFPYDWRRDPHKVSDSLVECLEQMYATNGNRKITVVAHSMGGLIALSAVNRRPDLFRQVIFVGTPFGSVPLVLWAFRRGAPFMLNRKLMSPALHFGSRTSYLFLPTDGRGFVDDKEQDMLTDFFSADQWAEYCLSPALRDPDPALRVYLQRTLTSAKAFKRSLAYNPQLANKYPPFTLITSRRFPTPTRIRASVKRAGRKEIKLHYPCHFKPGDGIVAEDSMMMAPGYEFTVVESVVGHWSMMNDLGALAKAFKTLIDKENENAQKHAANEDSEHAIQVGGVQ
ncbi:Alpha/Beta hydrolase protein [Gaertneriomyces semiglobifer]|nr:Alpha/Beta hydrolase protein [Gaertneriomyces semiglobifer]